MTAHTIKQHRESDHTGLGSGGLRGNDEDSRIATAGDPLSAAVNAALAPTGWAVFEVTISATSGLVRVVAERRCYQTGKGRQVILHRSSFRSQAIEERSATALTRGMFREEWDVVAFLGRRRSEGVRSALRRLADYIDDNSATTERLARGSLRKIAGAIADGPTPHLEVTAE